MYKHLLSFFMLLVVLCMGTTAKASSNYTDGNGVTWINVTTAQEFSNAITGKTNSDDVCTANIRVMNEIDLDPLSAGGGDYLFDVTFSGRITYSDAEGYAMIRRTQHTLFRKLVSATISNVFFSESKFDGRDTSSGLLADDCEGSTIQNVYFFGITAVGNSNGYDCDRIGIAVGKAKNSQFSDVFILDSSLRTDGEAAGYVCGSAEKCSFSYCHTNVNCSLWADGNSAVPIFPGVYSNAYAGGICGYADGCTLTGCVNLGSVLSDDDRIGGIIGYGTNGTTITDCRNAGPVKHCTQLGFGRETREYAESVLWKIAIGSTAASFVCYASYYNLFLGAEQARADAQTGVTNAENFNDYVSNNFSKIKATMPEGMAVDLAFRARSSLISAKKLLQQTIQETAFSHVGAVVTSCAATVFAFVALATSSTATVLSIYDKSSLPDEMGGIAGTVDGGCKIVRCVNSGSVECADDECGGIVGYLKESTVESCYNRCVVRGKTRAAGIVGHVNNGKVLNCLNVGPVASFDDVSSYYGITAEVENVTSGNIAGNYYLYKNRTNHGTSCSFTQEDLASGWVAKQMNDNLGEKALWRQNIAAKGGDFYPTISTESGRPLVTSVASAGGYDIVQKITAGGDFILAATNPNAQIVLENDIDLSGLSFLLSDYNNPFRGVIDGQGHTLANFTYQSTKSDFKSTSDAYNTFTPHHIALFPYTSGATFRNLLINNFHITQRAGEQNNPGAWTEGLLVGESNGSTFTNIRVRNSDILLNDEKETKWNVGGLIATAKNQSVITDCTIESSCKFMSYVGIATGCDSYLGGFVGTASHTQFTRCHNASELWAEDEYVGGICGNATNCDFVSCLNSGKVTGQCEVGGIVGYATSCDIAQCVNVGTIYGDENDGDNDRIAGIVGKLEESGSKVKYCLNFGDLKDIDNEYCGGIYGEWDDSNNDNYISNLYYYSHEGKHRDNLGTYGFASADVLSGRVAYEFKASEDGNQRFLYQNLDNDPFCTKLPVPIPAAGEVYQNEDCDGYDGYSNLYNNTKLHTSASIKSRTKWGFCTVCGTVHQSLMPATIEIASAADLMTLSKGVSVGADYSNTTITLTNDLDFEGITDFMPIGTSIERPFRGTINGNGHRIKNLHIQRNSGETGVGLIGVATGETTILGVIMDSSCTVDGGTSQGVGGLVGCLMTGDVSNSGELWIRCSGNEATVCGGENTAGLVGGVYDKANVGKTTSSCKLILSNSYNAGSIIGTKGCASLVGYGHLRLEARDCYNIGDVLGYIQNSPMIHYNAEKATLHAFDRLFQLEGLPTDANMTETITAKQLVLGQLAEKLNYTCSVKDSPWYQNLGTNVIPTPRPTPNTTGKTIYHERAISSDWGTAVLPYTVQSNEDVQLYALFSSNIDGAEGSITVKSVETVEPNTPFFFKKKATATSVSFDITANDQIALTADEATEVSKATEVSGWSVTGTYVGKSGLSEVYYLAQDKLWYAENPIEVPPFRAYFQLDNTASGSSAAARSISLFVFEEGEVNQIGEIRDGELHFFDGEQYNLQGQRVGRDSKGLLINREGKKVIIL